MSTATMNDLEGHDRDRAVRRGRAEDRRELHARSRSKGFYDGLIFHRVIQRLHAPGRLPAGHRHRRTRLHLRGRVQLPPRRARRAGDGERRARTPTARSSSSSPPRTARGSTASTPCSARSPRAWTSSTRSRRAETDGRDRPRTPIGDRVGDDRRLQAAVIEVRNPATRRAARDASRRSRRAELAALARARPRGAAASGRRSASTGARAVLRRHAALAARQRRARDRDDRLRDRQGLRGRAAARARLRRLRAVVLGAARGAATSSERRFLARSPLIAGRRLVTRYVPRGAGRRDRAVELPAAELLRRRDPGARRGQQRAAQALRADAADLAAGRRGPARSAGCPTASSRSRPAARATGEALVDLVDFVMFTGSTATGREVAARAARSR